jgi:hypothetical protein
LEHTSGHLAYKASNSYASKIVIAQALAVMGARAVTLHGVARCRPSDARAVYKEVWGTPSPSGNTPTNHEWFLGNRRLRQHAALLLLMYSTYRESNSNKDDAHGIAFTLAYYNYRRVYPGEPLISPERLALLVNGYSIGWREIPRGGASKFTAGNVKVAKCQRCLVPHLAEYHFHKYVCSECQARPEMSQQLLAA